MFTRDEIIQRAVDINCELLRKTNFNINDLNYHAHAYIDRLIHYDCENHVEKDILRLHPKILKLAECLKETLWEVKKEIQHHKDLGTALFWENDLIEKIDNAIEYYVNEVTE